jgi:GGDEF domain-containing protein
VNSETRSGNLSGGSGTVEQTWIISSGGESLETADLLVDVIRAAASEPIDLGHTTVTLGASAGAAESQLSDTASSLLKRADQALYQAKTAGRKLPGGTYAMRS